MKNNAQVNVIGAGLAGCEAAYQLAKRGITVQLYEQKPVKKHSAFKTDDYAELICSNIKYRLVDEDDNTIGLGDIIAKSLVSISVTTALAIGITKKLGGIVALTVSAVIITGILGASISDVVCRMLKLKNPISRGISIGNASHAAGTVKAMEMGKIEGSMSSLAIVLSGLLTAIVAPFAVWLFFGEF
mgnify:CR=1 FL=1